MKNFNIKKKFIILSFLITITIVILGAVAYIKSEAMLKEYNNSVTLSANQETLLQLIGEALQTGQALRNIYIDFKDQKAIDNLAEAIKNMNILMESLKKSDLSVYNELIELYKPFYQDTNDLHIQALAANKLNSKQILNNTDLWRAYKKVLKEDKNRLNEESKKSQEIFALIMKESIYGMMLGLIAVLVVIMGIFFIVSREIVHSVKVIHEGLMSFFAYLGNKKELILTISLDAQDEFGEMAKAINRNILLIEDGLAKDEKMVANTLDVAEQIVQGHLSETISEIPNNPQLLELKNTFNKMLQQLNHNIGMIVDVVNDYTHNNFIRRIVYSNVNGEIEQLMIGVNTFGQGMEKTLKSNFENGLNLKYQAVVLRNFVEQLSHASNEQAASLEETSAALEEITSNIASNNNKAATMAIRANEAKSATIDGEELATLTVASMDEIVQATTSINEAVAIIETIAFQTNILSLNAAVEAATAGEAGKGFAVVAQEVRSLANRSAEAAKTIKELTRMAKDKANSGSEVSVKMIEGFRKIAFKINETTDLVNDVAYANKEQMLGIEQINEAVTQLDQMTQESADMSNDTDVISSHVASMAQQLTDDAMQKEFGGKETIINTYHQREMEVLTQKTQRNVAMKGLGYKRSNTKSTKDIKQIMHQDSNTSEKWDSF